MYEGYLIEQLGAGIGGVLQTGRSRNDVKATVTSLRLRGWVMRFAAEAARLEAILLAGARRHQFVVMPIYTHFQAAMPVSYGYYLLGVARAVAREITALIQAAASLRTCPLGAGAVAGTDLPVNPERTAVLLGYDQPDPHALDAVASRDTALRLLGAAAGLAIVLSRLAADLQLWSTAEFGFVQFPDRLVGSSSAMPQKRNAFLLEHLKAKAAQAVGAWTAAAAGMSCVPFTNSIEVGTEAVASVWPGLAAAQDAVLLSQVLVTGARPDAHRMAGRARNGFTAATAAANELVRSGVPFRTAHTQVGAVVRELVQAAADAPGDAPDSAAGYPGAGDRGGIAAMLLAPDLSALLAAQRFGGGPGSFAAPFAGAVAAWRDHIGWLRQWRSQCAAAAAQLADAVAAGQSRGAAAGREQHHRGGTVVLPAGAPTGVAPGAADPRSGPLSLRPGRRHRHLRHRYQRSRGIAIGVRFPGRACPGSDQQLRVFHRPGQRPGPAAWAAARRSQGNWMLPR